MGRLAKLRLLHRNSGRPSASVTTERFTKENHYEFQVESFGRGVRDGERLAWTLEDARGTQAMLDMAFAAAGRGAADAFFRSSPSSV